jgi:hypothetical protein
MTVPLGAFGRGGDTEYWRAVHELYLEDWVEDALDQADQLGGLDSNDVFAEAWVRRDGKITQVHPWLTVEVLPEERGSHFDEMLSMIGSECEELSKLFGWDNREATLLTFLPRSVDAEWMPARYGYFVDKTPYDKICLPAKLLSDPEELRRGVRHEFMHAITMNLCNGHDPRWLAEAMSTLVEGRLSRSSWRYFRENPERWANPSHLIGSVTTDHRDPQRRDFVALGYDQCSFVGLYLYRNGGPEKLKELLAAVGDESLRHNLELQVLNRTRADGALRHVYGMSEHDLFERVLTWVRESEPPEPAF